MPTPTSFDDCPTNLLRKDNDYHVIPRPKAVGISWYDVRIGRQYQEIATP